jgi:hypothetical protein
MKLWADAHPTLVLLAVVGLAVMLLFVLVWLRSA